MHKLIGILLFSWLTFTLCGQEVQFSHPAGRYANSFSLKLTSTTALPEGWTIRYTTNGYAPKEYSPAYLQPLLLDARCQSNAQLFSIRNCPSNEWNQPQSVEQIIVVRAAVFDNMGQMHGKIASASFVIEQLMGRHIDVPIVSLMIDSADLLDQEQGIFVPGIHYDPNNDQWSGNYYQKGENWERDVHLDYLEDSTITLAQDCGIRTHGGNSRRFSQKGFALYARAEYGKKRFSYPFFPNNQTNAYKRLCLKPMKSAWSEAGIQDWLALELAKDMQFDKLSVLPVVLFINGEYWGIYYLEEKPDEHFVEEHHGYDKDDVTVIGNWFGIEENGNHRNFLQMMDWLWDADLAEEDNFNRICQMIDLDAFTDYQIFEMLIGNQDWPSNNMRCWQYRSTPWRWIFYDGDAMCSSEAIDNALCTTPGDSWPTNAQSTLMLRKLLENPQYLNRFNQQMVELLNRLPYSTIEHIIDSMSHYLASEIKYQTARFQYPSSQKSWKNEINKIKKYYRQVPDHISQRILKQLKPAIQSVGIYPNPIQEQATFVVQSDQVGLELIIIYDMLGRIVHNQTVTLDKGTNLIPIMLSLPNGLYVVKIGDKTSKLSISK